jgi:hypothetical protein
MFQRIYTGADGRSHFEMLDLPLGPIKVDPANPIRIGRMEPGYFYDFHTSPRRQYVITLAGHIDQGIGDGTVVRFGPGDVMLEEDMTGEGHTTQIGDEPRVYLVIPLEG